MHKMRRFQQELTQEDNLKILKENTSGVLSLISSNGYTYAVPLSYVYHDGHIYFHCAKTGHKIDAIHYHKQVSFCIIDKDNVVPEEFTTYFKSVIVFGNISVIEDETLKRKSLEILSDKYNPSQIGRDEEIDKFFKVICMLDLKIDHMSGKQAKELM